MGRELKYKSIIEASIREATEEKLYILKSKDKMDSKLALILNQEIASKLNLLDKKILMFEREFKIYNEPTIENLKRLLNLKELEIININNVIKSLQDIEAENSNEYMSSILNNTLFSLQDKRTKIELNIKSVKEDLLTIILMKALHVTIYEIEPVFYGDIRTESGYFFANLNDGNSLVCVSEVEIDGICYDKLIMQEGFYVYINIKNDIPVSHLPF